MNTIMVVGSEADGLTNSILETLQGFVIDLNAPIKHSLLALLGGYDIRDAATQLFGWDDEWYLNECVDERLSGWGESVDGLATRFYSVVAEVLGADFLQVVGDVSVSARMMFADELSEEVLPGLGVSLAVLYAKYEEAVLSAFGFYYERLGTAMRENAGSLQSIAIIQGVAPSKIGHWIESEGIPVLAAGCGGGVDLGFMGAGCPPVKLSCLVECVRELSFAESRFVCEVARLLRVNFADMPERDALALSRAVVALREVFSVAELVDLLADFWMGVQLSGLYRKGVGDCLVEAA